MTKMRKKSARVAKSLTKRFTTFMKKVKGKSKERTAEDKSKSNISYSKDNNTYDNVSPIARKEQLDATPG